MIAERLARQSNCFRNGFRRHVAAPLFNDRLPSNAGRHLLQDIVHQDPGSSECRLAMADGGIGDDESADHSACLPIILAVGHVEPLKPDYSPNRDKSPYSGEGAEESKVRPKKRIISPGDLKKERRKPGCAFLALDFQRTRPSSIRRKLTASLILEFHRRELGRGSPSRRCHHCWSPSHASVRLAGRPAMMAA